MTRRRKKKKPYRPLILLVLLVVAGAFLLASPILDRDVTDAVPVTADPVETTEPEAKFDKEDPMLILVNRDNRVDSSYVPEELAELDISLRATDRDASTQKLHPTAAAAFVELTDGASADGHTIKLTSGYRSYSIQQGLYNYYMEVKGEEWTVKYSAPPGASEHQTGLAADVSCPTLNYALDESFCETPEGIWLEENAHKYGFIIRYQQGKEEITGYSFEPWHIRYVGKDAAAEIYEQDITLEEFLRDIE